MIKLLISLANANDGASLMLASVVSMVIFYFAAKAGFKRSRLDNGTIDILLLLAGIVGLFWLPGLCRLAEYLSGY